MTSDENLRMEILKLTGGDIEKARRAYNFVKDKEPETKDGTQNYPYINPETSVFLLPLSRRLKNVLRANGYATIEDITNEKESAFTKLRYFGDTSLLELKSFLKENGLSFATENI